MGERLILGYPERDRLIEQIEAHMKPGEMVMSYDGSHGFHITAMTSNKLERSIDHKCLVLAPPPSFVIDHTDNFSGTIETWVNKPILLPDYLGYFRSLPRINLK